MKHDLILKYKNQLKSLSDKSLLIPEGYENKFWDWFEQKSKVFNTKKNRNHLRSTSIPIVDNFCYKNTYRIAKGFIKRFFYFEGFSYSEQKKLCLRHAFNVCKNGKVNDYSLQDKSIDKYDFYIGVKIPLGFARKVYFEHGDYIFTQDSLLVAYFMYLNGFDNYLEYTTP
jgi:hypothetical protein